MTTVRHLESIQQSLRDAGVDALWVQPSVDLRYLTGLDLISIERPTGLVIPASGGLRVAAPSMFEEQLADLGADVVLWTDTDGPEAAIARVLDQGLRTADIKQDGCRTVGTREMGEAIVKALDT